MKQYLMDDFPKLIKDLDIIEDIGDESQYEWEVIGSAYSWCQILFSFGAGEAYLEISKLVETFPNYDEQKFQELVSKYLGAELEPYGQKLRLKYARQYFEDNLLARRSAKLISINVSKRLATFEGAFEKQ